MKKILFFCFIIQLFFNVYSENNLKSLIPDYVISNEEFKKNKDEYGLYCLKYGYDVMNIEKVKDEPEYMNSRKINQLIKDNKLSVKNILELYEKGESFVLIRLFPMSVEETSNELISVDGKIVGETTFDASSDGKLASNTFGFTMKFIDDRMIHHFWINFIISKDYEDDVKKALSGTLSNHPLSFTYNVATGEITQGVKGNLTTSFTTNPGEVRFTILPEGITQPETITIPVTEDVSFEATLPYPEGGFKAGVLYNYKTTLTATKTPGTFKATVEAWGSEEMGPLTSEQVQVEP